MNFELVRRECAGARCTVVFGVMEKDPQKWCSRTCENLHGGIVCEEKGQSNVVRYTVVQKVLKNADWPKKITKKITKKKSTPEGAKNIKKLLENVEKPSTRKVVTSTKRIKNISVKNNVKPEKKMVITLEKSKETGTHEIKETNLKKSKTEEKKEIPQLDSKELSTITSQAELLSMNLIDKSANHLYELMIALGKSSDAGDVSVVHTAANVASEIRGLLKLKLDAIKLVSDITRGRR